MTATSWEVGGASDAEEEERDVGGESDDDVDVDVDVLEMVGTSVDDGVCLLYAKGVLSF
jgi:hypothetical protein